MISLTAKQESFIRLMTESEELARRGFDLLLKRDKFETFFDALHEAGLFAAVNNPAPIPVEPTGSFRLPYWNALDYLVALATLSGKRNDEPLARKVLNVVRAVTRDSAERTRDNYHTWRRFAEIIGLVPRNTVSLEDMELLPDWLGSQFDRGSVGPALDEGALSNFLNSDSAADWDKALEILRHCTAVEWVSKDSGSTADTPKTVVDDYWLKRLIARHATTAGVKLGRRAAELFLERVREVFGPENRRTYSSSYRPAVEEHSQNHRFRGAENRVVEGLRDVVLSWCDHQPAEVRDFVEPLLRDEAEIVRRVAIYVLGHRWPTLRALYLPIVGPGLFQSGHLHELYNLLHDRFSDMSPEEMEATVEAIRRLPKPTWADDPDESLKRRQKQWLSAIVGRGHEGADAWYHELASAPATGISDHPDFDSYMEVTSGPGPTPYQVEELVIFATEGVIVEKLNGFEPARFWRGPTMEGLIATLEEAVRRDPETFLSLLGQFLRAERRFQHAIIWGLKQAWDAADKHKTLDWNRWWEKLIVFFEQVLGTESFWTEKIDETQYEANRNWISSAIAEFLRSGTQAEERGFSADLMPKVLRLLDVILQNSRAASEPSGDPMMQAINSPKGKAVEALFDYTLRVCRVADREGQGHAEAWETVRPMFERELAKCQNANYEFSTLSAASIAHLDYVDSNWLGGAVKQIFPSEFSGNTACAIDGLAYAHASRRIYALLVDNGIIDRALQLELKGRYAREKLIERIALAYLWGDEELQSSRFSLLFRAAGIGDLEHATHFFWSVSGEDLSQEQKERILSFWERCIEWAKNVAESPAPLLSALSKLSCYLRAASGREGDLLQAVAPYVAMNHNAEHFLEELNRFVDENPDRVSAILGSVLSTYQPFFDYENRLKSLLVRLAEKGLKVDALKYAEQLRDLHGMQELFDSLTRRA
jgi:hypothetical protein